MKVNEIKYRKVEIEKLINEYQTQTENVKNAKSEEEYLLAKELAVNAYVEFDTAYNLAFIRWSQDVSDKFYLEEKAYYEETLPTAFSYIKEFNLALLNSKFSYLLSDIVKKTLEIEIKINSPIIESELIKESEYQTEYSNLISGLTFDFGGKKLPLSMLKAYMKADDRDTRKRAYETLGNRLGENSTKLNGIFDSLVDVRTKMAEKLGYKNFSKFGLLRMYRLGYGENELIALRNNVQTYFVPAVKKVRETLAKKLNIKDIMLYDNDNTFLSGEPTPSEKDQKLLEKGAQIYKNMSADFYEFYNDMLKSSAFDVLSRLNKWGGGYQTDLSLYNQPFILANFNGTADDIDVLTHEFGHALASHVASINNHDKMLNAFMETAETHSMTMEFLSHKTIGEVFSSENAEKYKLKHLIESFTFIPYGTMVDDFQYRVYNAKTLSADERNDIWLELESIYRPYLSTKGISYLEKGTRWQYQMHIYENPFYYIDYVLAGITALNFYILSLENYDLALEKYKKFLSLGYTKSFIEVLNDCQLPSPFNSSDCEYTANKILSVIESKLK